MKRFRSYLVVLIAIIGVSAAVASAQSVVAGKRPAGQRSLEDQIFKKVLGLPNYGLFDHITFQLNGNTVVLGGSVASLGTSKDAERTVKRIPGVERVVNNIRDLPPSPFDNQIRGRLVRKVANTPGLARYIQGVNPSVRLIVDRGNVDFEGYVSNRSDANMMTMLAKGLPDVFGVQNHLVVTRERVS
jgi:osmotically-inducible protein OsmY